MSLECNKLKGSVVHIRGHNIIVPDSDGSQIETLMWNPLHFAVYYGHLSIVKFIISLGINIGLSALKPPAESEKDPTNTV
jgi:hypothetical protein